MEKALLIGSGTRAHDARDIAESLTSLPIMLLNTHADIDHVGSNSQLDTFYMHPDDKEHYRKSGGKTVEKGTMCKMARREMMRYMAENHIEQPEQMRSFDRLGYRFCAGESDENTYAFIKEAAT